MKYFLFAVIVILSYSHAVMAGSICHGKFANPITDVCWACIFPISIGSAKLIKGSQPDTKNPSMPLCLCGLRPGISLGFWEPIALVDVTRTPYCLVNLGGLQLMHSKLSKEGEVDNSTPELSGSFYYVHWYKFPLLYWLNLLTDGICVEKGDFDIAYLTELDPTWHDDELTYLLNPEALVVANNVAQTACVADSLATIKGGLPIDSLFWCAGSQGSMYPLNGFVQAHIGGVQASTLLAERMAFKMHRELLLWDSIGKNSPAICREYPTPILPKSRYRYQMVNPIPTAKGGIYGCHPFGFTTTLWEANHEYPALGEDFGYLIFRKRNCCAF